VGSFKVFSLPLQGTAALDDPFLPSAASVEDEAVIMMQMVSLVVYLAMINTPRVFGREQRSPVRAVRRRLARTLSGPFVLHPLDDD
jgi:hypothetical protein